MKYYSNCLLECLKAWMCQPRNIKIKKYGSWKLLFKKGRFPHFYWTDKKTGLSYDFRRDKKDYKQDTIFNQLWFKGYKYQLRYGMM